MCWRLREQARSHRFLSRTQNSGEHHESPVGVSLLAMAVGHSILMLAGWTLSRAGSLLQGFSVVHGIRGTPQIYCGSELAREGGVSG